MSECWALPLNTFTHITGNVAFSGSSPGSPLEAGSVILTNSLELLDGTYWWWGRPRAVECAFPG